MELKKIIWVLPVCILLITINNIPLLFGQAQSVNGNYKIAYSFQYPISADEGLWEHKNPNGWRVSQDFMDCRSEMVPPGLKMCRHNGEDWNYYIDNVLANTNRSIRAIGNGYVVAKGDNDGFAGYIILKHFIENGSYVLSIYGHLSPVSLPGIDDYFNKGDKIAVTANEDEMKRTGFEPHFHFEIRGSKDDTGLEDDYLGDGYDDKGNVGYFDPTDIYSRYADCTEQDKNEYCDWNLKDGFIESHMGLTVTNFEYTSNTICAEAASNDKNQNFTGNYTIKNDAPVAINIDEAVLAIHDENDVFIFNMHEEGSDKEKKYLDITLKKNEEFSFEDGFAYFAKTGKYKVVAKVRINTTWRELAEKDLSVVYPFSDVKAGAWYYNDVVKLKEMNVIKGYDNCAFKPDGLVTRAEFVKMVVVSNITECQEDNSSNEKCGKNGEDPLESKPYYLGQTQRGYNSWYYPYVKEAWNKGWLDKTKDIFRPDDNVRRGEAAKILALSIDNNTFYSKQSELIGYYKDVTEVLSKYPDDPSEWWYAPYVVDLTNRGIIDGYPDKTFRADQYLTRAEAAKIIYKRLSIE